MTRITLTTISKSYDNGFEAVNNISLDIQSGEFVVLLGPSGCGKSTTLRMIAGLEEISSGELAFDGERMNETEPKDRDVGMVFQNYALYPHLTVFENLAFPLRLRREDKAIVRKRVEEVAAMTGLSELLDRKPKQLSGGQRQRVALGRAVIRKPRVFLFDEPLSNLDAQLRTQMRSEISRLQALVGSTAVYVTHDQTEAMTMGDRIVVMRDGIIQQVGTPAEVYNNPVNQFVAGFLGSPSMNFIDGNIFVDGDGLQKLIRFRERDDDGNGVVLTLPPQIFAGVPPSANGSGLLGVRPEHVSLKPFDGAAQAVEPLTFHATVQRREYLGHEVLLHVRTSRTALEKIIRAASVPPDIREGSTVKLFIHPRFLYAFDGEGRRI